MKTSDFFFELPKNLIAQFPLTQRGQSRLMTLNRVTGKISHCMVSDLPFILSGDNFLNHCGEKPLMVLNDTKVRKARLFGKHEHTGAESEFLLLEKENDDCTIWKTMSRHIRRKKAGNAYIFIDSEGKQTARAVVRGTEDGYLLLEFNQSINDEWLDRYGHIPLPPYIKRGDTSGDAQCYQTVYARQTGSVASPTAGLHFTKETLEKIAAAGIESAYITLHVGLGTFLPVRSENIKDHIMHEEQFIITDETATVIEKAKVNNRKIIAVGTTSIRTLESAFTNEGIKRGEQSTSIFIYPPYKFKTADALFTNFHTPLSTLLMLVSAFADGAFNGRELILEAYAQAVKEKYRFFSYGDAMLIY
ncbi:MAG: tRNA preQ1(34) S-adenosylmethionine ribosyltransferase-isomerase QueA [Treponema sp.]|jgi:S-adenosylmethionine:tRNA ribosyltransferase-isomerase|nr:tRNA preQ1(34) S-adenosylmethionine ribosyltransferase-isomerase QueA [Treponema sp.]